LQQQLTLNEPFASGKGIGYRFPLQEHPRILAFGFLFVAFKQSILIPKTSILLLIVISFFVFLQSTSNAISQYPETKERFWLSNRLYYAVFPEKNFGEQLRSRRYEFINPTQL